ncbi:MAG: hypothetical protein EOP88_14855 [Verrucomicrobiaceae bacterium]|nr:MAG: hypothetical protein EOP88_14855 [Verrucomicrobiaceae bacterium]
MNISPLLAIALLFAGAFASAQEMPERHVRFLPLGELPPFRQQIRDGIRVELEPPPGSIPPREVVLGFGEGPGDSTPLRLGETTTALKIPPGPGPLLLRQRDAKEDSKPWLSLSRPENGDFLVLLWRDSRTKTWENARSMVLPDDRVSAPAGSVRFVNCSPATIGIALGKEKLLLGAGKMFRRDIPSGKDQVFQVYLADTSGGVKVLHAGALLQNGGERGLVLIYRADGVAARRPLKVAVRREMVPALPPAP